jgi:hypothetical protein
MTITQSIKEIEMNFKVSHIYARGVYSQLFDSYSIEKVAEIIAERPKPFVKWVGGKRQLLKQFRRMGLYPPEGFDPAKHSYFEPFVGGGAVFFDLLPRKAHLSDMNCELVTTYRVIRDNVEQLIRSLRKHPYNKEYFLKIRAQDISKLSPIQVASRFIYLNRTGFNGMVGVKWDCDGGVVSCCQAKCLILATD